MASLNKVYLKKTGPTDVLSFPTNIPKHLGDIIIAVDIAKKQAKRAGRSLREQCFILIVHGLLHLVGFDHYDKKSLMKMALMEKRLIRKILRLDYSMLLDAKFNGP